jgi:hypothetical protein
MKVRHMFNAKLVAFKRKMFKIMRDEVNRCRRFRIVVLDNWKGYFVFITSKPFRAWCEYVEAAKNKHNELVRK